MRNLFLLLTYAEYKDSILSKEMFISSLSKIKTEKNRYQIVASYTAFLKRAMRSPLYAGFKAGIIVEQNGQYQFLEGSFKPKNAKLVGGWCEIYRKEWKVSFKHTVNLDEFDSGRSNWQKMKAFMIMKVAIAQAHRLAFPEEVAGLYIAEELEETKGLKEELLRECYSLVKENPHLEEVAKDFLRKKGKTHSTELEIGELQELRDILVEAKG